MTHQRIYDELGASLSHLLRRAQQTHTALWTAEFGGDLTGPQYAVLSVLVSQPGLGPSHAGAAASLDRSSAGGVMDRLERDGWIRQARDGDNGRRIKTRLTVAAHAALRHVTPRAREVQQALLHRLDLSDRAWFVAALASVAFEGDPPRTTDTGPEEALPLSVTPGHLLRRAEQLHRLRWNKRLGDTPTPPQFDLLRVFALVPGVDQRTAGEIASLDKASTTDIAGRLRRQDLIAIQRDQLDRRVNRLELSKAGTEMLNRVTPQARLVQAELLAPLPTEHAGRLLLCLHRVAFSATEQDARGFDAAQPSAHPS